ncbi:hypothetical protein GAYE_SCF55G6322 [Galdieria yellowstonensis]|uniref:Uncharacterized protein n=1 Tax=Galdieria yellowstonensis TaxID=3028027 RepID=A0AAV9IMT3_9RHOD|nr:hypothetical protein GAYE_SCF55G6322 [Galdieria yellowstonensis]
MSASIVEECICFLFPCKVLFCDTKQQHNTCRHKLFCVAQRHPPRPRLTEEFYLSVGTTPRFTTKRKPGDLLYPIDNGNRNSKNHSLLLYDSLTRWLWLGWRNIWNLSFYTIKNMLDKWKSATKPAMVLRYPTKPSYVYPFKEWEPTTRTYYVNCFGEKRYIGYVGKVRRVDC